jgi:DNA mismatch repair protein MutL
MAPKIKILPDIVVNKIAAGEVIDRPYSIVRELVDNSLDAGATRIHVEIERGGRGLIRVSDDGCGLSKEDAILAFERYATSKLQNVEDLYTLVTKGFRGEALSSIASIASVVLKTKTSDAKIGTEVCIDCGMIKHVRETSCVQGTMIEVKGLFKNIPVRKKFLRSDVQEEKRIRLWLGRYSIAPFHVNIQLAINKEEIFHLPKRASAIERSMDIFKMSDLIPFEEVQENLSVNGALSHPSLNSPDSEFFAIFVNNRLINDKQILKAVKTGYGQTLKAGEFPVGFISIALPSDEIDINVHPQKLEVRFAKPVDIMEAIRAAVQNALIRLTKPKGISGFMEIVHHPQSDSIPLETKAEFKNEFSTQEGIYKSRTGDLFLKKKSVFKEQYIPFRSPSDTNHFLHIPQNTLGIRGSKISPTNYFKTSQSHTLFHQNAALLQKIDEETSSTLEAECFKYSVLQYYGQLFQCYLLCSYSETFYIVDMHAAHERVNYYRYKKLLHDQTITVQKLIVPVKFPRYFEDCFEVDAALDIAGFEVTFEKEFVVVTSAPSFLPVYQIESVVKDIIKEFYDASDERSISSELHSKKRKSKKDAFPIPYSIELKIDKIAALMACHGSVRSGDIISRESVYSLFEELDSVESSGICPHGRNIVVEIKKGDIEKMFGRS